MDELAGRALRLELRRDRRVDADQQRALGRGGDAGLVLRLYEEVARIEREAADLDAAVSAGAEGGGDR